MNNSHKKCYYNVNEEGLEGSHSRCLQVCMCQEGFGGASDGDLRDRRLLLPKGDKLQLPYRMNSEKFSFLENHRYNHPESCVLATIQYLLPAFVCSGL